MIVWVLTYWPSQDDREVYVFSEKGSAEAKALEIAIELWGHYSEDDWPPIPHTWSEIFQVILDLDGACWDVLEIDEKEVLE